MYEKPGYKKYLLFYSYSEQDEEKKGWHEINTEKRPDYKTATTFLKRSLTRKPATAGQVVKKVIHLYCLP